jgi:hypothetical protein
MAASTMFEGGRFPANLSLGVWSPTIVDFLDASLHGLFHDEGAGRAARPHPG